MYAKLLPNLRFGASIACGAFYCTAYSYFHSRSPLCIALSLWQNPAQVSQSLVLNFQKRLQCWLHPSNFCRTPGHGFFILSPYTQKQSLSPPCYQWLSPTPPPQIQSCLTTSLREFSPCRYTDKMHCRHTHVTSSKTPLLDAQHSCFVQEILKTNHHLHSNKLMCVFSCL